MTSFRRQCIRLIERVGLRGPLGVAGGVVARKVTGTDVALFYDDIWIRRIGDAFFGDKATFDYYLAEFRQWNEIHHRWLNDPADFWLHAYTPRAGDVVVDIGAGFGNDALLFSRAVGPTGKVVAIEAHPDSFRRLEKTCKWSGLDNVVAINCAVAESEGEAGITGEADAVGNAIGGFSDMRAPIHKVRMHRFDDIAREIGLDRIDFLKVNIEGAERPAFLGMKESLKIVNNAVISCHDFRAIESGDEFFRTREFCRKHLEEAGFHVTGRESDPRAYVADTLYASRPAERRGS